MMMARRLRGEEKGTGICWIGRGNRQEMIHHLLARARGHRGIMKFRSFDIWSAARAVFARQIGKRLLRSDFLSG
jgi:hypothetical protein